MPKNSEHPKVGGKVIGRFKGLVIYGNLHKAKTEEGKDRIWIQIRQAEPKHRRVYECLSYARSVDVQFTDD
jgi:hypothetical protein